MRGGCEMKKRTKRKPVVTEMFSVRMEVGLKRAMEAAARADGRTASGWVVRVLAGAVKGGGAE